MFDLRPACQAMTEVLGRIAEDRFDDPTPCREYTVADLIDHVDLVVRGATSLALGDGAALSGAAGGPEPVHLEPGWPDVMAERLAVLGAAWRDAAAWSGSGVPGSDLSNETWAKIVLTELVVHGWDLAKATGQVIVVPEPTLRICLEHVAAFVPDAPVPGLWGPPLGIGAAEPPLDRVVAITGRSPAWQRSAGGHLSPAS